MLNDLELVAMFRRTHEYIDACASQVVADIAPDAAPEQRLELTRAARQRIAHVVFEFASLLDGFDSPAELGDEWRRVNLHFVDDGGDHTYLHDAFGAAAGGGWRHNANAKH